MEISPVLLAKLLLYSFCFGVATGIFYDINRLIRSFLGIECFESGNKREISFKLPLINKSISLGQSKNVNGFFKGAVIFVGDMVTVMFAGIGILVLNYSYNDGTFRFFTVVGVFAGFLMYFFTVGQFTKYILSALAFFFKYCFCAFFVILGYPFKYFLNFVIKFVRKIFFLFKIVLEKRRKRVYNIYEKVCSLDLAKNGFMDMRVISETYPCKKIEEDENAHEKK